MLPTFLGIGTQRGATTWLANCLREHPDVFVPELKEASFFDIHYRYGWHFYEGFFGGAQNVKAVGEITPDYLYCLKCPERIARHLPDVKLFAILRNPIERAYSAYIFFEKFRDAGSFENALHMHIHLMQKGLYYE